MTKAKANIDINNKPDISAQMAAAELPLRSVRDRKKRPRSITRKPTAPTREPYLTATSFSMSLSNPSETLKSPISGTNMDHISTARSGPTIIKEPKILAFISLILPYSRLTESLFDS